ncbi:MAG: peptide ABC transporter substrate-binding protein [Treponema sp.]|nr:peptide ABC transporter substrate-binding protein [Treponema sp.]
MAKFIKHSIILALAFFSSCASAKPAEAEMTDSQNDSYAKNKTLVVAMTDGNYNLNPHTSAYTGEAQILNSLYEGLFSYNPQTLDPEPAIALSYKTSRDGKYWTFTLRPDAKFSDGRKITSKDVKESWLNLIAEKEAFYSSFLDVITGAKDYRLGKGSRQDVAIFTKDDVTISIELDIPQSHLPKILCHHAFAVVDTVNGTAFSGPYSLVNQSESEFNLCKNANYYNASAVKIPNIKILLTDDEKEVAHDFNTGKIHWCSTNCDTRSILKQESVHFDPLFGTYYYFFKLKKPWLTKEVRNALMNAFPWEELRMGSYFPAKTLIFPLNGYKQPVPLDYTDLDHAQALLDKAKKSLGITDEFLELEFAIPEGQAVMNAAQTIKHFWGAIGIKLKIKVIPERLYLSSISGSDSDMFLYTWIGDFSDPVAFLELFRSDSSLNETLWKNSEFDSLLDKASLTHDRTKRYELLNQAEEILLDSGLIMPISHSIDLNIIDFDSIGGWTANPLNIHPFKEMYFLPPKPSVLNIVKR